MFKIKTSSFTKKAVSLMIALIMTMTVFPAVIFAANNPGVDVDITNVTTDSCKVNIYWDYPKEFDYYETICEVYEKGTNVRIAKEVINNNPSNNSSYSFNINQNIDGDTVYRVEVTARYERISDGEKDSKYREKEFTTPTSARVDGVGIPKASGSKATTQFYYKLNYGIESRETGVVYTTNSSITPTLQNSSVAYGRNGYNSETVDITLTNLTNQVYYLRSFVQYRDANLDLQTVYSNSTFTYDHRQSNTAIVDEVYIYSTNNNVVNTRFYYDLDSNRAPESVGIVYTTISGTNPTLENMQGYVYGSASNSSSGTVSVELDGLHNNTYYIRGFVEYKDSSNKLQVAYSDTKYSYTHENYDVPSVSTTRVKLEGYEIYAVGEIYDEGRSSVTDFGFVYNYDDKRMPTLDSKDGKVSGDYRSSRKDDFEAYLPITASGTCFVRAYAKNSYGTSYGELAEISLKGATASVNLVNVGGVTADSVTAKINVPSQNNLTIIERGVLLSRWKEDPGYEDANVIKALAEPVGEAKTGETTITVDGLEKNTKYYIRAYVKTANLGVIYSSATGQNFTTENENYISTVEIKDIGSTSAIVVCNVVKDLPYAVLERGIVYSSQNSTPTISNSYNITDEQNTTGEYSIALKSLDKNKTYYARAYVRTINGYEYGAIRSFKTSEKSDAIINITFATSNGTTIGTQKLSVPIGTVLDSNSLDLPQSYVLETTGFRYTVSGSDSIMIVVRSSSDPIPTPPGQETAFTEGVGNYKFDPDVAMTRGDVAKILYNLLGEGQIYPATKTYTDVPYGYDGTNAVNFVTYKGYFGGYEDGSFGLNQGITRAELTVVVCKAFALLPNNSVSVSLTDISNHWGISYIMLCVQNSVMSGYTDKTFKPDRPVTRAETVTIFSNVSGRSLTPLGTQEFVDVPKSHWAYNYIMNAAIPK